MATALLDGLKDLFPKRLRQLYVVETDSFRFLAPLTKKRIGLLGALRMLRESFLQSRVEFVKGLHPVVIQAHIEVAVAGSASHCVIGRRRRVIPRIVALIATNASEVGVPHPGDGAGDTSELSVDVAVTPFAGFRQGAVFQELARAVANGAVEPLVNVVECERRVLVVGETQVVSRPSSFGMTDRTSETHLTLMWIRVAPFTVLRHTQKPSLCKRSPFARERMAPRTRDLCVLSNQRKSGISPVRVYKPTPLPAVFRVTLGAGSGELSPMRVLVASFASHRQESRPVYNGLVVFRGYGMALLATQVEVLAHERKPGTRAVSFDSQLYLPPAFGMTPLAINPESSLVGILVAASAVLRKSGKLG